jgi:hypothetical protein
MRAECPKELAVNRFNKAWREHEAAGDAIDKAFRPGLEELLKQGKFQEAREYLRPIPIESVRKVLMFREIILREKEGQ